MQSAKEALTASQPSSSDDMTAMVKVIESNCSKFDLALKIGLAGADVTGLASFSPNEFNQGHDEWVDSQTLALQGLRNTAAVPLAINIQDESVLSGVVLIEEAGCELFNGLPELAEPVK